jgi:glycosyltransferase involved in cell wall biosynthesis
VPPGDEEALADAILELLGSPERLATIGAYATELSQTVYDWKAIARQTLDFYESLLVRGRAA